MTERLPVRFRPSARTRYRFERLRQCGRCGAYTVLHDLPCASCGAGDNYVPLRAIARRRARRAELRDMLVFAAVALAGCFLARSGIELAAAVALSGGAAVLYACLLRCGRFREALETSMLKRLLEDELPGIREGLLRDIESAADDLKSGDYKTAYEKLREIGYLIEGDQVKVLKLLCLNRMLLRADLDLELSSLVPSGFEPDFIRYFGEICKIAPQLVKRDALDYIMKHRWRIQEMPDGRKLLAAAAGAALRVRSYAVRYEALIADAIPDLPQERLLRLKQLLDGGLADCPELARAAEAVWRSG
ncbi:hypothetical protein [Paenibacillus ginsengihumi]|uniref:hypothetical protein n=1 Tax=Paenibacillus ginsengihumi TaxID=431596 RepID=UPI0003619762|nr:hypothetical protein [Paenibacillus ginsengihumi]